MREAGRPARRILPPRPEADPRLHSPRRRHIASSLLQLAASPELRTRLGAAGVRGARSRSWERSLSQLAAGYRLALDRAATSRPGASSPAVSRLVA